LLKAAHAAHAAHMQAARASAGGRTNSRSTCAERMTPFPSRPDPMRRRRGQRFMVSFINGIHQARL
jgi:hypothetical protein